MPPREPTANLRPFRSDDYPALHALLRRIDPEYASSADDLRALDEQRRDEASGRAVLERGGELLAAISFRVSRPARRLFQLGLSVPDDQAERFDELYEAALAMVAPERPLALTCTLREDRRWLLTELQRRGYREHERNTPSRLDLTRFDAALAATGAERLFASGLRPTTYAEAGPDDPESQRRLYDLEIALIQDIPWAEPLELWDFETWRRRSIGPAVLTDHIFLAETGDGAWIGTTSLRRSDLPGQLRTGLTGVLPGWRGRGVASALKLAAIDSALERGAREITTLNHSHNRGMRGVNERLGFVAEPAWLTLRLDLESGDDA